VQGVGSTPLVIKDNLRSLRGHLRDTTDSLASAAANRCLHTATRCNSLQHAAKVLTAPWTLCEQNSSAAKIMSSFASSAAGKMFKRDSVE